MKLLYITNQICNPGGLERVLSIKANYLINHFDYEVHMITLDQGDLPLFYDFSHKIIFHDIVTNGNFIKYVRGLQKKVNEINPQCICVCDDGLKGFYVPYLITTSCPIIYERHASKNIVKNANKHNLIQRLKFKIYEAFMHFGAKKFDAFVVLTQSNRSEWPMQNVQVIANPLSFYPERSSLLENKKLIAVGSHNYQKGFDRLLRMWKQVSVMFPDWHLDIYGRYDAHKTYIKLATEFGLLDSVHFYEPVKNIEEKYLEASIYVMPSRSEGFGMVLIEAMASGLPCISFDCPSGPKDIISHNVDGILVENGDLEAFSIALKELMSNVTLRKKMGTEAKLKVQNYQPQIIVSQWHALFNSLS